MFKKQQLYIVALILLITGCLRSDKDFDFRDLSEAPFYFETEGFFNVYANLDFEDEGSFSRFSYRFSSDNEVRHTFDKGSRVFLSHYPEFEFNLHLGLYFGNQYLTEGLYSFDDVVNDLENSEPYLRNQIISSLKNLDLFEKKIFTDLKYLDEDKKYYLVSQSGEMNITKLDEETLLAEFTIEFARVALNNDEELEIFKKSIILKGRFLI